MRRELFLSHCIVPFENLNEVLASVDDAVELASRMSERYGDRLGYLLRRSGSGETSQQATSQAQPHDGQDQKQSLFGKKDKKDEKRREGDERGWIALGSDDFSIKIANGSPSAISQNEVSVLFKVVETLKSKLATLQVARKLLSELPSQGFATDQKLLVVFKDGIPRQVIPTSETSSQTRFRYMEQFQMSVLK